MAKKDKNLETAKNTGVASLGFLVGFMGAEYLGQMVGDLVPQLQTTLAQAGVKAVGAIAIGVSSIKMKNKTIPLSISGGVGASSAKDLVATYLPADSPIQAYLPITSKSSVTGVGRLLHLDYSVHRGRGSATRTQINRNQARVKVY